MNYEGGCLSGKEIMDFFLSVDCTPGDINRFYGHLQACVTCSDSYQAIKPEIDEWLALLRQAVKSN